VELELATNEQLVDELMRRNTFGGVIIYAINPPENRRVAEKPEFAIRTSLVLETAAAKELLQAAADRL
jgi:hypothetical protein